MKQMHRLGFLCLGVALSLSACSSDSPAPAVTAGGSANTGTSGSASLAGMECAMITTDPTLTGTACNIAHDKCYYQKNNGTIRDLSGKCATGLLMTPDRVSCIQYVSNPTSPDAVKCYKDCVAPALKMATGDVVSDTCLQCPDDVVTCGAKFCLSKCLADSMAPECTKCLCSSHADALGPGKAGSCMIDAFAQCAGFRPTPADVGCDVALAGGAAGTAAAPVAGSQAAAAAGAPATAGAGM